MWRNVWVRAALLHPALFVTPGILLCVLLAYRPGSGIEDISWGFWAPPLGTLAGFVATVVLAARARMPTGERLFLVFIGALGGGIVFVFGYLGWFWAADVACHGGYECPF